MLNKKIGATYGICVNLNENYTTVVRSLVEVCQTCMVPNMHRFECYIYILIPTSHPLLSPNLFPVDTIDEGDAVSMYRSTYVRLVYSRDRLKTIIKYTNNFNQLCN